MIDGWCLFACGSEELGLNLELPAVIGGTVEPLLSCDWVGLNLELPTVREEFWSQCMVGFLCIE